MNNTNLTIEAVKRADGLWHFDHLFNNTKDELLCNGTEKVIDMYYSALNEAPPNTGDTLKFFLSTESPDIYDTVLTFIDTDDSGTTYLDIKTKAIVWLCPWLQGYFGHKPETIYVKVG